MKFFLSITTTATYAIAIASMALYVACSNDKNVTGIEIGNPSIAGIGIRTNEYIKTYPAYAPALHLWGKYYVTGNKNSKYSEVTSNNWQIGIIDQVDASGCDGTWTQATRDSIRLT